MKNTVLHNLNNGYWSILDILGPFENALNNRLKASGYSLNSSLFIRTLRVFTDFSFKDDQFVIHNKMVTSFPSLMKDFFLKNSIPGIPSQFSNSDSQKIKEAISLINMLSPESNDTLKIFLNAFIYSTEANFYGASHPHILGAIVLGEKFSNASVLDAAISIVHEMGHQELFLINTLDRVVRHGFEYNMIHAPFQGKARPPIARMHSLFALYRMVQVERLYGIRDSGNSQLMDENLKSFSSGELTEYGEAILAALQKWKLNA
jgi:hypothetical protein